jgi:hypothetical protein
MWRSLHTVVVVILTDCVNRELGGEKVPTTKNLLIASWMKNKNSDKRSGFDDRGGGPNFKVLVSDRYSNI